MPKFLLHSLLSSAVFLALLASAGHASGPVTLYKQKNIEIARANIAQHSWARDMVKNWQSGTEYVLEQDERFFEEMISPLTPWPEYGQSCPACVGRLSTMGETGIYTWSVRDPDHLKCRYCGTVYPNSEYPESGSITASKMGQTFTFYLSKEEREHPGDKSGKYAFQWASWPVHTSWSGILRYKRASWCISQVLPLAKLYAVTGEVRYAERAALIMDTVARRFPNWLYHSYNGTYADCPGGEAAREIGKRPRGGHFPVETIITAFPGLHTKDGYAELNNGFWGAGRFGCSGTDAGMVLDMAVAYDLIHEAKRADGSPALTPESDHRIVQDLILPGCEDSENWDEINNKCGPSRALSGAAGILFGRPESVRRALQGFEELMNGSFHIDGFCEESPSYSGMHLGLMQEIPEILLGYSDPPGYQPPEGKRLTNFDPFKSVERYRLAQESMVRMLDFNRKYPVIGDTHYGEGISPIYAEILTDRYSPVYAGLLETVQGAPLGEKGSEYALWNRPPDLKKTAGTGLPLRSEWFPGWHVGVMRGKETANTTALYFNGYARHGHRHFDTLGILYGALGKELMSDRGYIWDDPRNAWTKSTLAHNLVTVDGASQDIENCHSTLELFGTSPLVEVVQASANAYGQCDRYRRTTALVQAGGGSTYLVDFFRVSGGKQHWYSLHCNGSLIAVPDAASQPYSGEIQWLSNIRTISPQSPVTATWEYEGVRLDITMLSPVDRFLIADAPGWRSNKGSELKAPPIQEIIAEHTDGAKAVSRFAVIAVPYGGGKSPVKSARLILDDPVTETLAIAVEMEGRTDYVISAPGGGSHTCGPVTITGSFGVVSTGPGGKATQMYLADGTGLRCGSAKVTLPKAGASLAVGGVSGRTFQVKGSLPAGIKSGLYLLSGETGYEIESVRGSRITVRDYPAVESDSLRVIGSGWRKW